MHRRAAELGVALVVESRVEIDQLRDEAAGAARRPQLLLDLRRHDRLVGDVESDHRHVDAALEDAARGLRIGPDVELGRRRRVPLADRTPHQHDSLGTHVGMEREQQRDVRQRPGRDEGTAADARREEVDRVLG